MSMTITKKLVLDNQGQPSEVLIPYEQYIELVEACGLDLDSQEQKDLSEALADSISGNRAAFVDASEI